MITDIQTDKLYLSDCLPNSQPKFFPRFKKVLDENNIDIYWIPDTKDIWAVDFMPIQVDNDRFVQFRYNPDYLQDRLWRQTISNVDLICKKLNIAPKKSKLIVDGGNIVKWKDKVIMCDKVFYENKKYSEKEIIKELKELFKVEKLYFVPWDINDFTGHADGMVRFINSDKVLINDYFGGDKNYEINFKMSLHNAGLEWIELPYYPQNDSTMISARGLYLNFLQMEQAIIVPTFKIKHDEKALRIFGDVFKGQTVVKVDSNELADEGGILNCITWNIVTPKLGEMFPRSAACSAANVLPLGTQPNLKQKRALLVAI